MSDAPAGIEQDWTQAVADIPARGLDQTLTASPAQRDGLAAALEILGVEHLEARCRIESSAAGRYRLTGTVEARVVQACVVTLDPVVTSLAEPLDVEFRPAGDLGGEDDGEEQSAMAAAEHEPIEHGRLPIGRIVAETVAASLPAYPRTPDAALDQHEAGPADGGGSGPFAALAGWRGKRD